MKKNFTQKTINILKSGGIGVLPTDTIYGLVGRALNPDTVERIYQVRKRRPDKPLIILIADIGGLDLFGIVLSDKQKNFCQRYWPGKISIIFACAEEKFAYLHRGTNSLAFRLPDNDELRDLVRQTGPLVAPSANPEGLPPAMTATEAKDYFGNSVDFYVDIGRQESAPSTLASLISSEPEVLRSGAVDIR